MYQEIKILVCPWKENEIECIKGKYKTHNMNYEQSSSIPKPNKKLIFERFHEDLGIFPHFNECMLLSFTSYALPILNVTLWLQLGGLPCRRMSKLHHHS